MSFVFVALNLLSRITSNSDSQNGFNLILHKVPILRKFRKVVTPYLLAKITNSNTGLFFYRS